MMAWTALVLTLLCTVGAQLAFKSYHVWRKRGHLLLAILLFGGAVPCTVLAVRELGIARVYVAAALTYVVTPLIAVHLFKERFGALQKAGLALILAGVIVYNLPWSSS